MNFFAGPSNIIVLIEQPKVTDFANSSFKVATIASPPAFRPDRASVILFGSTVLMNRAHFRTAN